MMESTPESRARRAWLEQDGPRATASPTVPPSGRVVAVELVLDHETGREFMRKLRELNAHEKSPEIAMAMGNLAHAIEAALFRA